MSNQYPTNQPNGANHDASNASNMQPPSPMDFAFSARRGATRVNLCHQFKNMVGVYLTSSQSLNRAQGDNPSEEARESANALKFQWNQDLVEDDFSTGLYVVLKHDFLREAEEEVARLERFKDPETAVEVWRAWVQWKDVVKLVDECKLWKDDVDREMAKFK